MPVTASILPVPRRQMHRSKLGGFEVTTLLADTRSGDKPQEIFGTNASPEDFAALSAADFIPAGMNEGVLTFIVGE